MGNRSYRNQSVDIPEESQLFNDRMKNNDLTYQKDRSQRNFKKICCSLCCCKERGYSYEQL